MRLTRHGAAFLDRDGTLNVKAPEGAYVERPDQLRLLPGAARAVRRLNDAGVPVIVVTNQRGIALGLMGEDDLAAVHVRLEDALADAAGARLDEILHCPHAYDDCDCRKPRPGLLLEAVRRRPDIDLSGSAIVGDAPSDIEAGRRAGSATVLLAPAGPPATAADHVAADLGAAVAWLLADED